MGLRKFNDIKYIRNSRGQQSSIVLVDYNYMQFGNAWANRPCQCKTAQLSDKDQARQFLGELLQKSIERVVNDFLERTYYE